MKPLILIFSLVLSLQAVMAQNLLPDPITISTNPEAPAPGQSVTVSAQSLTADLNKSDISWSVNGRFASSGFGLKSLNLNLPFGNQAILIEVTVKSTTGETFYAKKTISPKRLILITEAVDSYVPYWYGGKAEVANAGRFRVYAYAEIYSGSKRLQPSELLYKWSVRDEPLGDSSGVGRDTLTYKLLDEYGDDVPVSVTVSPVSSDEEVTETTNIKPKNPELLAYLGNEYGDVSNLNTIKNNQTIKNKTFSVVLEPFFFSTDSYKQKNLEYSWYVNNNPDTGSSNYVKFFRLAENATGTAIIDVSVKHLTRLFQEAKNRISINF